MKGILGRSVTFRKEEERKIKYEVEVSANRHFKPRLCGNRSLFSSNEGISRKHRLCYRNV